MVNAEPNHPLGKKDHGLERKIFRERKNFELSYGSRIPLIKRLLRQKWQPRIESRLALKRGI